MNQCVFECEVFHKRSRFTFTPWVVNQGAIKKNGFGISPESILKKSILNKKNYQNLILYDFSMFYLADFMFIDLINYATFVADINQEFQQDSDGVNLHK